MTKQTDIFDLIQDADQQLHQKDDAFFKLTDHILQLLRAKQIIPIKRVNENQFLHLVTAGILTSAHLNDSSIFMTSRRTNNFVDRGVSTQVIKWLDLMVKHNVLVSQMHPKAVGTLTLSEEFLEYITDYYYSQNTTPVFEKVAV
tara:strand:- start:97 stop:528 length:432 start_codon:yes stop_codon:yes gene_type:complete